MNSKPLNQIGISILLGTLTSLLVLLCILWLNDWAVRNIAFVKLTAAILGVGIIVNLISYYLIKKLVVSRISGLHKIIRTTGAQKAGRFKGSPNQIMTKAQSEIETWTFNQLSNKEQDDVLKQYRQEFTGNIAHELKTPLFSIEGYVHTLLDGAMKDPALTKKYLSKTVDNIDRLSEIIEALSTISKFESGELKLKIKKFDVVNLIKECLEELRIPIEKQKLKIEFAAGERESVNVLADRQYISQVLINLLTNSIRYGDKKGLIKIEISTIGEQVLVEIIDDGIGIAEEHLAHIFDRFYRTDPGRSRKEGGSGIGLAIVKHIILAHEQRVQVSSALGKGSNFSFTLKKA